MNNFCFDLSCCLHPYTCPWYLYDWDTPETEILQLLSQYIHKRHKVSLEMHRNFRHVQGRRQGIFVQKSMKEKVRHNCAVLLVCRTVILSFTNKNKLRTSYCLEKMDRLINYFSHLYVVCDTSSREGERAVQFSASTPRQSYSCILGGTPPQELDLPWAWAGPLVISRMC